MDITVKKRDISRLINHWEYNPANEPESYFYALLLLFQPWRNTGELRGNDPTYAHALHWSLECNS